MKALMIVLLGVFICYGELFMSHDTLIMSQRGILATLHVISTDDSMQVCTVVGYYHFVKGNNLQFAVDTIVVKKRVSAVPKLLGYHEWHKANDSTWRDYFYFTTTGVRYQGTFIQYDSFNIYVNNKVEVDTVEAWSFFNTYSAMALHIGKIYQQRVFPNTGVLPGVLFQYSPKYPSGQYLLNGKLFRGSKRVYQRVVSRRTL
jgi:hypothetical protein